MTWSHKINRLASVGFVGIFLCSNIAIAQETAQSQQIEPASAQSRNPGEGLADYVSRLSANNPQGLAGAIATILRDNPADLAEIMKLVGDSASPNIVASDVARGLVLATAANPVAVAQQTSAFAMADSANTALVITLARQANTNAFSEVLGEGLALAASALRAQGTSSGNAGAVAIQAQATAQAAPLALAEAFMDNYILTAAGAAGPGAAAGPGGGGEVSNNAGTFNAGTGALGAGGGGVAQSGGSRTAFTSAGFSFANTRPITNNTFTTLPVPGPEAGAGVGGLVMASIFYWMSRRKAQRS